MKTFPAPDIDPKEMPNPLVMYVESKHVSLWRGVYKNCRVEEMGSVHDSPGSLVEIHIHWGEEGEQPDGC